MEVTVPSGLACLFSPAGGFVTFVKSNAKTLSTAEPSKVLCALRGYASLRFGSDRFRFFQGQKGQFR